jgi:hypothetical protein
MYIFQGIYVYGCIVLCAQVCEIITNICYIAKPVFKQFSWACIGCVIITHFKQCGRFKMEVKHNKMYTNNKVSKLVCSIIKNATKKGLEQHSQFCMRHFCSIKNNGMPTVMNFSNGIPHNTTEQHVCK